MRKRSFLVLAVALGTAALAPAQRLTSGRYDDVSPNGAFSIRTRPGYAVMLGIRLGSVLRRFYPNQASREFYTEGGPSIFFEDHALDDAGNCYAAGRFKDGDNPSEVYVVKLDLDMNIVWERRFSAPTNVRATGLDVTPDGSRVAVAFQDSGGAFAGVVSYNVDGTPSTFTRTPGVGRTAVQSEDVRIVGDRTVLATHDLVNTDQSYPVFTQISPTFTREREVEFRPTTGRGTDGRDAKWRLNDWAVVGSTAARSIVFTARDGQATRTQTLTRLTGLVPGRGRSLAGTFVEAWHQDDGMVFGNPRAETRMAIRGRKVAWLGRHDGTGGGPAAGQPYRMLQLDSLTGAEIWLQDLPAAADDTTTDRDGALGGLSCDTDGVLRTYNVESTGSVRTFAISGATGDFTQTRIPLPFFLRHPVDPRGSIGRVTSTRVILGLGVGWTLTRRRF